MNDNSIPKIEDSKFFALCKNNNLLQTIEPSEEQFGIRLHFEEHIDAHFYNEAVRNDGLMHILISYKNHRGNNTHKHFRSKVRLFDRFDIDDHFEESKKAMYKNLDLIDHTDQNEIEISQFDQMVAINILNILVTHILDLEKQDALVDFSDEEVVELLGAYLCCLYQDPKFIFIYVCEKDVEGVNFSMIDTVFKVKSRPTPN